MLCSDDIVKEKRENVSAICRTFLCSLFIPPPHLLLPKSCFDSLSYGQGSSLSVGSMPPFPSGNIRGTRDLPQPSREAALSSPAGTCSHRYAAQDVVAVLLLSLLPIPASLARKSTTFPIQTPAGALQVCFPGSTRHLTVLDRFLVLKHQPGREVPTFCSLHLSSCVSLNMQDLQQHLET